MKKQLLIAGIICGIICAACVFLYTEMVYAEADSKRSEALERYGGEQVEVVVATRTIHPGETLDPSNCTTKTWLSDLLPDGALMELSEMEGKQATSLILEGEVVSQSRFNNETQELDIDVYKRQVLDRARSHDTRHAATGADQDRYERFARQTETAERCV